MRLLRCVLFTLALVLWLRGTAPASSIKLNLHPAVYTVLAGGQVTLLGSFTTPDALTWTYDTEFLFGLDPTSPHLGIVSGSVLSSEDFDPPLGSAYFLDIFGGGGYLGPVTVKGPAVTPQAKLRTVVIPADTPPGLYSYSYGVRFLSSVVGEGDSLFDTSLQIKVVPEPSSFALFALGVAGLVLRLRLARKITY